MTYIVTSKNKAFKVPGLPEFDIKHLVGGPVGSELVITSYYVSMDNNQISPLFRVMEEGEIFGDYTDEEYDDARCDAEYQAVNWLCDLLERLETHHPAVIHCTSDGEMFMQPTNTSRPPTLWLK